MRYDPCTMHMRYVPCAMKNALWTIRYAPWLCGKAPDNRGLAFLLGRVLL